MKMKYYLIPYILLIIFGVISIGLLITNLIIAIKYGIIPIKSVKISMIFAYLTLIFTIITQIINRSNRENIYS